MEKSLTELKKPLLDNHDSDLSQTTSSCPSAVPSSQHVAQPFPSTCRQIFCAGCRTVLKYQDGAYCVQCPICRTLTAVVPLSQLQCSFCRQQLMYPANALYVACTCGRVFSTVIVYPNEIVRN